MKRLVPYLVGLFFVARFAFACSNDTKERDDENFREDVVFCEEAIARIDTCCPGVTHDANACHYHHYLFSEYCGCEESGGTYDSEDSRPVLSLQESKAVVDADSCGDVACGAMQKALLRTHAHETHSNTPCHSDGDEYYDPSTGTTHY